MESKLAEKEEWANFRFATKNNLKNAIFIVCDLPILLYH